MTSPNEEAPTRRQGEGFDSNRYPISTPKDTAPAKRERRKRGRPRCTCALYGVCEECRGIADRRRAAELRRRES